jgi:hypothetical protein
MTRKKQRGPRPASERAPIGASIPSELLARVDRWAASQEDDPSRPEAIRRLVELGLRISQRGGATKAAEMASQEIDRLSVPSATDEERQLRKRRLIKGPKEFRDLRRNRPKT